MNILLKTAFFVTSIIVSCYGMDKEQACIFKFQEIAQSIYEQSKDLAVITQALQKAKEELQHYNIEKFKKQLQIYKSATKTVDIMVLAAYQLTKKAFYNYDQQFLVQNYSLPKDSQQHQMRNNIFNAIFETLANCFYRLDHSLENPITESYVSAIDFLFKDFVFIAIQKCQRISSTYLFDYINFISRFYGRDYERMSVNINTLEACCNDLKIEYKQQPLGSEQWWTLYIKIIETHLNNFSNDPTRMRVAKMDSTLLEIFNNLKTAIHDQKTEFETQNICLKPIKTLPTCKEHLKNGFDLLMQLVR